LVVPGSFLLQSGRMCTANQACQLVNSRLPGRPRRGRSHERPFWWGGIPGHTVIVFGAIFEGIYRQTLANLWKLTCEIRGRTSINVPGRRRSTVQRFRGGLVFKAHRLCVSLNSRLESNKEEKRKVLGRRRRGRSCISRPAPRSCLNPTPYTLHPIP